MNAADRSFTIRPTFDVVCGSPRGREPNEDWQAGGLRIGFVLH
jgi:hypothetical protein